MKLEAKQNIAIVAAVLFFGWVIANEMRLFKPTNYLECKTKKGTFYLKIIQRTKTAEEYPNSKFKEDEIVKSFDVDIKKNYMMLSDDMGWNPPPGFSKTDDVFPINRKTLKIYDPIKKKNLGQCTSQENKI
tara:strand:- start:112 stop:504 length:393 start_codon:yes stop_codon:yes gene_type:complete